MTDALLERLRNSPVVGRYFDTDGQLVIVSGGIDDGAGSGDGDGGDGSGEGGEGAGSGQGSGSGESGAGDQGGEDEGGEETKLTPEQQAIIDAQVTKQVGAAMAKKLDAERKKWETEVAEKAKREKMDEAERLKAEKADADKAVEEARRDALMTRVEVTAERLALKADVDPDRVPRFIQIARIGEHVEDLVDDGKPDEPAITKLIESTLKDWPEFKATHKGGGTGRSGGEFNGNNGSTTPATLEDAVTARLGS